MTLNTTTYISQDKISHFYWGGFSSHFFIFLTIALQLNIFGCSISNSSASISNSSESVSNSVGSIPDSSESFSDSVVSLSESSGSVTSSKSSRSGREKKYDNEVSDYTMAYVKSSQVGTDYSGFLKGLSDIAAKQGIVNWDQEPKTYIAIGKGLKKAEIKGIVYDTYKRNFANSDEEKMQSIQKGYESEK